MAKRIVDGGTVRVQVMMDPAVAEKVAELSQLLGMSTSATYAMLVEKAVADNGWIIKNIAAPIRRGFDRMLGPDWRERGGKGSADAVVE